MSEVAAQVGKILTDLGASADAVAATLRSHGIQGVRNTVRFLNPIVRHVQGILLISSLGMDLMEQGIFRVNLLDGSKTATPLPRAVQDFLAAFDSGSYRDLEMPIEQVQTQKD